MAFYEFFNQGEKDAKITIHSQIGSSWFDEGIDSKGFLDTLSEFNDAEHLDVHINSPGGNVFDGVAIYNSLKNHKAKVTVTVDGMAASIASIIAMAGDEIVMPLGSTMFVHNPLTWAAGNAHEMREIASELDKITESLIDIYQDRTGMSRDDIADLMDAETTMTAQEAKDWGFATKAEKPKNPVLNTVDMQAVKETVKLNAVITQKDKQIQSMQKKIDEAQNLAIENAQKLDELTKKPEPMDAKEVIDLCKEKEVSVISDFIILNEMHKDSALLTIDKAVATKELCKATGIDSTKVLENIHSPVEMMRFALNELKVMYDEDGSTNHATNDTQEPIINTAVIYASRQNNLK